MSAEEFVSGLNFENLGGFDRLEKRVRSDGRDVDAVLLHVRTTEAEDVSSVLKILARLHGVRIAVMLPVEASVGLVRRFLVNGADTILTDDLSEEAVGHMMALLSLGVQAATFRDGIMPPAKPILHRLSDRELQVLQGVCDGLQNKEIAHNFNIKEVTVKMHVRAVIRKLDAKNRTHAAMIARDMGLVD